MNHVSLRSFFSVACILLPLSACTPVPTTAPSPADTSMMQDDLAKEEGAMKKDDDKMMEKDEGMMEKDDDKMMEKDDDTMMKNDDKMMERGSYIDASATTLAPSVLADGTVKVLFFWAGWCPTCKAANTELATLYDMNTDLLSTYKINYDTESSLKARYGVTTQHTFVKVDGQGNVLKVLIGPANAALAAFLKS